MFLNTLVSILSAILVTGGIVAAAVCEVQPTGGDDHNVIVAALTQCANGGTVHFDASKTFILGSAITDDEYPSLSGTHIEIEGTVNYRYPHVGAPGTSGVSYWEISGSNVVISGSGVINGGGQGWWGTGERGPKLMQLTVNRGSLTGVTFNNGPFHVLRVGGNDFTIDGIKIRSVSNNYDNAYPASTDGMNIYGKRIIVQNVDIIGGDDCISFLNGADTVHINNVRCGGPTHGISVGSLGSSTGGSSTGTVKNILIENIEFYDGGLAALGWTNYIAPQFVARIKTYNNSGDPGAVTNVTWQHVRAPNGISNSGKTAVYVTQNYGSGQDQVPGGSTIKITFVTFKDITGGPIPKASKYGSVSITCSAAHHCDDILIEDIEFTGPHSSDQHCLNTIGLHKDCSDCGDEC